MTYPRLWSIALAKVGNHADAEDICQTVLLALVCVVSRKRLRIRAWPYVLGIVARKIIDYQWAPHRRKVQYKDNLDETPESAEASEEFLDADFLARLRALLGPQDRAVLEELLTDRTPEQIFAKGNRSLSTVYRSVRRIRALARALRGW